MVNELSSRARACAALFMSAALASAAAAQETTEERLDRIEAENAELRAQLDALAGEIERFELRDVMPQVGQSVFGLGPAASKVYAVESGLSIGGYGEALYQAHSGSKADTADFLRGVFYVGYKFDPAWVFNSEIEFEHASTDTGGSASVEFAYIDHLRSEELNLRAGLVLLPMGFVNELHEPTAHLGATRPETEQRIIPSTWRENGVGLFGDVGPFTYRAYVANGLDATGFSADGLRGGRQKGSKALAEDVAFVGRLDWTDTPGLVAGGSLYTGGSGQGQAGLGDTDTTIIELHGEAKWRGFTLRALAARAEVDDVAALNLVLDPTGTETVGEEMEGAYVELGYDVLAAAHPQSGQALTPFVRWESLDTQARVPAGFSADPSKDEEIVTFGVEYRPIDEIVFKLSFQDLERGTDRLNLLVGYVF